MRGCVYVCVCVCVCVCVHGVALKLYNTLPQADKEDYLRKQLYSGEGLTSQSL